MTVRWWAVRLLGAVLLVAALGMAVIMDGNHPDGPTCDAINGDALRFGTPGCIPIDWSPVFWLLGIGVFFFLLPVFFSKKS
jgi:hypothetical protein